MDAKLHIFQALNNIYIDLTNHYFAFSSCSEATFLPSNNKTTRYKQGIFEEQKRYEIFLQIAFYNSYFNRQWVIRRDFREFCSIKITTHSLSFSYIKYVILK